MRDVFSDDLPPINIDRKQFPKHVDMDELQLDGASFSGLFVFSKTDSVNQSLLRSFRE